MPPTAVPGATDEQPANHLCHNQLGYDNDNDGLWTGRINKSTCTATARNSIPAVSVPKHASEAGASYYVSLTS